jgi:hypothetical protein
LLSDQDAPGSGGYLPLPKSITNGLEHQAPIKKREGGYKQIEPQFLDGDPKIFAAWIIGLRPSSDSGLDKVAQMIVRICFS